jgi:glycosyltransferase involved in cell wall biosynthesis
MIENQYKLTLCVPCFERPQRTIRLIKQVLSQDIGDWEAYFVGDNCPYFQKNIDTGVFSELEKLPRKENTKLVFFNMEKKGEGWGYAIRNKVKELSKGKYFIFVDNDDMIDPNHFSHYLSGIENTNLDFAYYDTFIEPLKSVRKSELRFGKIGHSELIMRTDFIRNLPPHTSQYGHDWTFISDMVNYGGKYKKIETGITTYTIMGIDVFREQYID